jgi:hypothetical protein
VAIGDVPWESLGMGKEQGGLSNKVSTSVTLATMLHLLQTAALSALL